MSSLSIPPPHISQKEPADVLIVKSSNKDDSSSDCGSSACSCKRPPTPPLSTDLSYPTDTSTMPPHVLLAHENQTSGVPALLVTPPRTSSTVLLHSCCAPCSGAMIHEMSRLGLEVSVVFYNPNIHPYKEYLIRKLENKKFCEYLSIPFIDLDTGRDYESARWFALAKGEILRRVSRAVSLQTILAT